MLKVFRNACNEGEKEVRRRCNNSLVKESRNKLDREGAATTRSIYTSRDMRNDTFGHLKLSNCLPCYARWEFNLVTKRAYKG